MDKGDHDSAGGPGGRGARCSFVRSHRFHIVVGIAVLLSLVTVGLVCLTIIRETSPTSPDRTTEDLGSRNNSKPFLLVADYGTENEAGAILQVDITSGSMVKLPLDVDSPRALDYDPLTDYVYWSEKDGYIKRACRDGSGMETIIDLIGTDFPKTDGSSARTLLTSPVTWTTPDLVLDPRNG
ncbi:uncharacterized protein LOC118422355 [Branchiostoma floridae]|uniref:Uncharacterized protein LOC118422355 n=1 Tax=Branchiostoma floridae TaxID=7739 RepID=A0A9J7LMQ3_BRAFL|nr:uncharacterized protein LOC118422355 [Branchiostoma floridae]